MISANFMFQDIARSFGKLFMILYKEDASRVFYVYKDVSDKAIRVWKTTMTSLKV